MPPSACPVVQFLPLNWQFVSAVVTFLAVLVALFGPSYRERRRVTVEAMVGPLISTIEQSPPTLILTVTNKGKSAIWITKWIVRYKKESGKKYAAITPDLPNLLPKLIAPTEQYSVASTQMLDDLTNVTELFVVDSLNKYWRLRRNRLSEITSKASSSLDT